MSTQDNGQANNPAAGQAGEAPTGELKQANVGQPANSAAGQTVGNDEQKKKKSAPKGLIIALIAVGASFLIFIIIILLIVILILGGMILKKKHGEDPGTFGNSISKLFSKEGYKQGEFTYDFNDEDIYVDVDAIDGKHFRSITVHGVGDVDRNFPCYYDDTDQSYGWMISFYSFNMELFYENEDGDKGVIHPEDMTGKLHIYSNDFNDEDVYEVRVTVMDDAITFHDITIPEEHRFDMFANNYGGSFTFFSKLVNKQAVYLDEIPIYVNGEKYDYEIIGLPSVENATTAEPVSVVTTEEAKTTTTEQKTQSTTEAPSANTNWNNNKWIAGSFYSADPNCAGGSESILTFNENGTFSLHLNFGEGFCDYTGTYVAEKGPAEMDDTNVYLTFNQTTNNIPKNATVIFSDSPDYCEFMTPGFGLIGYGEPPYGMSRR